MRNFVLMGLILAIVLTMTTASFSQTSSYKNGLGIKALVIDYSSPLSDKFFDKDHNTMGIEYRYSRFLNNSFNLAFPARLGYVEYPTNDSTFADRSMFASLGLNLIYKFNNGYLLKEESWFAPYVFVGGGAEYLDQVRVGDNIDFQLPFGLGFNFRLSDHVRVQLQSEYRVAVINEYNNFKHSAGLIFLLGEGTPPEPEPPADKDGDGIIDMEDECPDVVGIAKFNGCPDTDEDGLVDSKDECPKEAGPEDNKGCPWGDADKDGLTDNEDDCPEEAGAKDNKGCPWGDADGDGVTDNVDNCPSEAGPADNAGCPVKVVEKDTDGDGIIDKEDNCPSVKGLATLKGCPDMDGDGITDAADKCPNKSGLASNQGCPEVKEEVKQVLDLAMRSVQFETGSATLKTSSYAVLDQLAGILKEYPEYSVSIGGHTDNVGAASSNLALSERRAKACYDYLVKKGISGSRISYAGYGETQPIADNASKEGRSLNRRVEFNIFIPRR